MFEHEVPYDRNDTAQSAISHQSPAHILSRRNARPLMPSPNSWKPSGTDCHWQLISTHHACQKLPTAWHEIQLNRHPLHDLLSLSFLFLLLTLAAEDLTVASCENVCSLHPIPCSLLSASGLAKSEYRGPWYKETGSDACVS